MTLPRLVFRDVRVAPYDELLEASSERSDHRGGPDWPDWRQQTVARHRRRGVPVDDPPRSRDPL